MRYALITLLVVFTQMGASAQKQNLFADIGISGSRLLPGSSVTYNYKLFKFLGLGAGVQAYAFFPTITHTHQYVPALYGDMRFTIWPRKKNQFFVFLDVGANFYSRNNISVTEDNFVYNVPRDNGTYSSFGIGYFRRMTNVFDGLYISLKTISNAYTTDVYDLTTLEQYEEHWSRGTIVLSAGFRFGDKSAIHKKEQDKSTTDDSKEIQTFQRLDRGPFIYITTSTGTNNNTAIMGFNLELPLRDKLGVDAGVGTGTWNNKIYVGAKYYLKPAQRGFAFGGGLTYTTGTRGHEYYITTIYGDTATEKINKNPQTNIFCSACKYWNLGKKYNRFYAQLGWSVPISSGDKITQLTGDPINEESKKDMLSAAPGGPIIAIGISFGVH